MSDIIQWKIENDLLVVTVEDGYTLYYNTESESSSNWIPYTDPLTPIQGTYYFKAENDTSIGKTNIIGYVGNNLYLSRVFSNTGTETLGNTYFISNCPGAIYNTGNMTLSSATFRKIFAAGKDPNGGAIYNQSGSMTLSSASFLWNSAFSNGGAIYNQSGSMTLDQVVFDGNLASNSYGGAIYNDGGSMTLGSAAFNGNSATEMGGAIYNGYKGSMNLSSATFSGNSTTSWGGAIHNAGGSMTLSNAAFSGNKATSSGGGIYNNGSMTLDSATFSGNYAGSGGAIYNKGGSMTVSSAIFSGNSTWYGGIGGAIYNSIGTFDLTNARFEMASDTIYNTGTMTFAGIISLAGNLYTANTITATGADMVFDISSYTEGNTTAIISDISKISGANSWSITVNANQALGTYKLASGAASFTESMSVKAGDSTLIDSLTIDGETKYKDGKVYTLKHDNSELILTVAEKIKPEISLEWIWNINADGKLEVSTEEGYTLYYATVEDPETWTNYTEALPPIQGNYNFKAENDTSIGKTNISGYMGQSAVYGGAINNSDTKTLGNAYFLSNSATSFGGAVYNTGSMTLSSAIFSGNSANGHGGAIFNVGSSMTLDSASFNENSAAAGGAIDNAGGSMTMSSASFSGNSATYYGGAIHNAAKSFTISTSLFDNNTAGRGGAILNQFGSMTLNSVSFRGNSASFSGGGAVFNSSGNMTFSSATFYGNIASNDSSAYGGAIFNTTGSMILSSATFDSNIVSKSLSESVSSSSSASANVSLHEYGGAIYNNNGSMTLGSATFTGNIVTASAEGSASAYDSQYSYLSASAYASAYVSNTVEANGGAIYNSGSMTLGSATFSGNKTEAFARTQIYASAYANVEMDEYDYDYGKLYLEAQAYTSATISATANGGAICNGGVMTLSNAGFSGNTALVSASILAGAVMVEENYAYNGNANLSMGTAQFISANGGAICNSGSMTLGSATFSGNKVSAFTETHTDGQLSAYMTPNMEIAVPALPTANGGAVYNTGSMTLSSATFSGNTAEASASTFADVITYGSTGNMYTSADASANGGAIYTSGELTLSNASFYGNHASTAVYTSALLSGYYDGGIYGYESANATANGGAIYNKDSATLFSTTFSGNSVSANVSADCYNYASQFIYTSANVNGGAVYNIGSMTLSNTEFLENTAYMSADVYQDGLFLSEMRANGGAVYNVGSMILDNALFSGNTASACMNASVNGGAVYNTGSMTLTEASFSRNRAVTNVSSSIYSEDVYGNENATAYANASDSAFACGGVIYNTGNMTLNSATFDGNQASAVAYVSALAYASASSYWYASAYVSAAAYTSADIYGGVIYNTGSMTLSSATFSGNIALASAHALASATASASVSESEYYASSDLEEYSETYAIANAYGGAICNISSMTLSSATFSGNIISAYAFDSGTANAHGGAIYNINTIDLSEVSFIGNVASVSATTANAYGGAIYNNSGSITLSSATFRGNSAGNNGGAVYNTGSTTLNRATFEGNAAAGGGAVYNTGSMTLSDTTFTGNAAASGGAIYNAGSMTLKDVQFKTQTDTVCDLGSITFSGTISLAGNLCTKQAITASGTDMVLDISSYEERNSKELISDIENISGAQSWTINIAEDQALGTYILGTNAFSFTNSMSVKAGDSILIDSLTVDGASESYDNKYYSLRRYYSDLRLLITESALNQLVELEFSWEIDSNGQLSVTLDPAYSTLYYSNEKDSASWSTYTSPLDKFTGTCYFKSEKDSFIARNEIVGYAGQTADKGGGLNNPGNKTLSNAYFISNTANSGGAIYNTGSMSLFSAVFNGNKASSGGAVYNLGSMTMGTVSFSGNTGDAIDNTGSMTFNNAGFSKNTGRAIINSGNMTLNSASFSGNSAGAILNHGSMTLSSALFNGNTNAAIHNSGSMTLGNAGFSGNTANSGGAIYNIGSMTLGSAAFSGNAANKSGGAIYNLTTGSMGFPSAIFSGNSAGSNGGAIYNSGNMTFDSASFNGNSAGSNGGAIYNTGSMGFSSAIFSGNSAGSNGGAIYNSGSMTLDSAVFSKNAAGSGGAIHNLGTMSLDSALFLENIVEKNGNVIYNTGNMTFGSAGFSGNSGRAVINSGTMLFSSAGFSAHSVSNYGAAICNNGSMTLTSASFSGNIVTGSNGMGGAVYNNNTFSMTICNASFEGNSTYYGGAIYNSGNMTLSSASFSGNSAISSGGAINNSGTLTLSNVTFVSNVAEDFLGKMGNGGAINNDGGCINLSNVVFSGNIAGYGGGAIYNSNGTVNLNNIRFKTKSDTIANGSTMTFTGTISLAGNLYTKETITATEADMVLDISSYTEGNTTAIISDISKISGANSWAIMVNADQTAGTYKLASGATSFTGSISVKCEDSTLIDSLTIDGETKSKDGKVYTLKHDNSDLVLTITGKTLVELDWTWNINADGKLEVSTEEGYTLYYATVEDPETWTNYTEALPPIQGNYNFKAENDTSIGKTNISGYMGQSAVYGGAINNSDTKTLGNAYFLSNSATSFGGAVYNTGSMTLSSVSFAGNSANSGGAIFNTGHMTLSSASFSGNTAEVPGSYASAFGGAIFNTGHMTLGHANFSGNSATCGGAIYNDGGTITFSKDLTLCTDTDTIVNNATLNWDITGGTASYAKLSGYDKVTNSGTLSITVNASQEIGDYTIATGVSGTIGKDTFTLTGGSGDDIIITVGDVNKQYSGSSYSLAKTDQSLVLSVGSPCIAYQLSSSVSTTYDGNAHCISITATAAAENIKYYYSLDNGTTWNAGSSYSLTDAGAENVCFKIKADGYQDTITDSRSITISKRSVTLTSEDDTKVYDGTPLTNDKITVGGDGFVKEDSYSANVTGTQTEVGSSKNTFTYELTNGATTQNYEVTKVEGTLEVTKSAVPITITAKSGTQMYNGSAYSLNDYTYTGTLADGDELVVTVTGLITNVGTADNVVSSYKVMRGTEDVTGNYTFNASVKGTLTVTQRNVTLTSNSDSRKYNGEALEGTVTVGGDGFVIGEATASASSITDAGTITNTITVNEGAGYRASNYNISKSEGTLTVTKRQVTLTSADDTKIYDGTPLTNDKITVGGDGFVKEDSYSANVTGTQTEVGSSKNTFTYELTNGAKTKNYNITTKEGTLTVNSKTTERYIDGETITISEEKEYEQIDIRNGGKLIVDNNADVTTRLLKMSDNGDLDVNNGNLSANEIVVSGTGNEIIGDNLIRQRIEDSITVNSGAELILSKDLLDELMDWNCFRSEGILTVKQSEGNALTQQDIKLLMQKNAVRSIVYQQDLIDINNLTFDKNIALNVSFENGYGTSKNDKIKFSKTSVVTLGNGETQLDLLSGTNSIQSEANSWIKLEMDIFNLSSLTVASGSITDKKQGYTIFSAHDLTTLSNTAKISVGNYAVMNLENVQFGSAADNITIGKQSSFTAGDIDFGTGKNVFSVGSCSTVNLNSLSGEFGKLSVSNGSKDKYGVITESQLIVKNDIVGSEEKVNTLSIGNYAVMQTKKIHLGSVNDKISIGTNSQFSAEMIDFGTGTNTMSVGTRSSAEISGEIKGLSKLTVSNGSYDKKSNVTSWSTLTAGNITGVAETASTYSFGNYNTIELGNITTQNKNDQVKVGSDSRFTAGTIALGSGNNSVSIGTRSSVEISGEIKGLSKLTVSNGSYDKKSNVTSWSTLTTGNITGVAETASTYSFGNYNTIELGNITTQNKNDQVKVGSDSRFTAGTIALGSGNNSVSIGSRSTAVVGNITGLNKLTLPNGTYDKKNDITSWTQLTAGEITGTTGNDTFTFGNYCDADMKGIQFEGGNDTLKIGNYSDVNISGNINFISGKNTVQIGNDSEAVLKSEDAGAVTKFTIGKESKVYLSSELFKAVTKADKTAEVFDIGAFEVAKNFTSYADETDDNEIADVRELESSYDGWLNDTLDEVDYLKNQSGSAMTLSLGNEFQISVNGSDWKTAATTEILAAGATVGIKLNEDVTGSYAYKAMLA